jgi:hypothetical protein
MFVLRIRLHSSRDALVEREGHMHCPPAPEGYGDRAERYAQRFRALEFHRPGC